ncbi:unnamed protein product [Arabis nemorensis]|uniref:RNase H type-1 domain-containing protein n=1 Tax=Arabis nemorensis TaxID=586526 RepID=A0A565CNV0_9BRAS|nr:unnamed protein product [Arabis nemorensis]
MECGVGWIFTKQRHVTLLEGFATYRLVSSTLVAEGLAIKAAICAASNSEMRYLNLLSDSLTLVTLLNNGGVINKLKSLTHLSRKANVPADTLVEEALKLFRLSSAPEL